MKKFWNLIKEVSMPVFGIGYALVWVFHKLADKKDKHAMGFEIAGFISYVIGTINAIIYLVS